MPNKDEDITNQQLLDALSQQLGTISDNMVVRADVEEIVEGKIQQAVKGLATKDELKVAIKGLATKDELKVAIKGLATRDELKAAIKGLATRDELKVAIKGLATKDELKAAAKGLATKDDLNSAVLRLERKLNSHQKANVSHHLEARSQIGKLNKEFGQMREGLAHAASLA